MDRAERMSECERTTQWKLEKGDNKIIIENGKNKR